GTLLAAPMASPFITKKILSRSVLELFIRFLCFYGYFLQKIYGEEPRNGNKACQYYLAVSFEPERRYTSLQYGNLFIVRIYSPRKGFFPGPYFVQGPDHKAGQESQGCILIVLEHPVEDARKQFEPEDGPYTKCSQFGKSLPQKLHI